ncbi:hypothetical protein ABPG74_009169 [Tetrahymena malaccensis]
MFKIFKKSKKQNKSKRESSLDSMKEQYVQSTKAKNLPPRFAEQLLFLEMEMEQEIVDLSSVKKLLELYANAIEYYESIKSDKYFIFKNKTQSLLLKPNVSSAMIREQMQNKQKQDMLKGKKDDQTKIPKLDNNLKVKEELNPPIALQQQQKEHNLKVQYINAQDSQENAKILLCQHKQEQNYTKNIINGEIKNQTNEVLKRLEQRRKSKLEKVEQFSQIIQRDRTISLQTDNSFDERKKQFEESSIQKQNIKQLNQLLDQLSLQKTEESPQSSNSIKEDYTSCSSQNEKKSSEIGSSGSNISPIKEEIDLNQYKKVDFSSNKKKDNQSIKKNINDLYQTPNKENDKQLINKIIINGFSNSSSNQANLDSPVLIKMNSYGKNADQKQLNMKWMTASTNNFHNAFQFN